MIRMDKDVEIANGPSAQSTVPLDKRRTCTRCGERPRVHNQRWCRVCRAAWKRDQRIQRKAAPVPQSHVESDSIPPGTPTPVGRETGNTAPPITKGPDPAEVHRAREAYRFAVAEYERAKNRNWYQSPNPPGVVLVPLWCRVEAAKRHLCALGVKPDGEQRPPTLAHQP